MLNFVNRWIDLKLRDGTIRKAYRYWILGEGAERRGPRWSIMRNVLGWGTEQAATGPQPGPKE